MAVDARHLNLLPPQLITNRDYTKPNNEVGNMNMYGTTPEMGVQFAGALPEAFLPFYQSLVSMKSDSGLTYAHLPTPKKRTRESLIFPSFLGEDISYQIQQQQLEIDQMVQEHTKKMRLEIEERQKLHARQLVSAIGEGMGKKLKEKDEQIQTMGKLNWVLQERVKSLYMENQVWRDLAQSNEATANSLRCNLEQVLAHVSEERFSGDDAESCCGSSDTAAAEEEAERRMLAADGRILAERRMLADGAKDRKKVCRKCGERESCVLVLPCRHLCLCTLCGSTLPCCPICDTNIDVTLHVNLS